MNLSFFIAQRIAFHEKTSFSRFIIRIAIVAVTLSVGVMIIGSSVTQGYQQVISHKFHDCWGHVHVTNFLPEAGSLLNDEKIQLDTLLLKQLQQTPGVKSVHPYSVQSVILKTTNDMDGLLLKGLSDENGFRPMKNYLTSGREINFNDTSQYQMLISKQTAEKMSLKAGDKVILYFLNKNLFQPKARKVLISGIYSTGLEDYDKLFGICSASLIRDINQEEAGVIQGYELHLSNASLAEKTRQVIYDQYLTPPLQAYTLKERFPGVFSWLDMMKMNERIILIMMMVIAVINMITALLILILERTNMVGILKSLGMSNGRIRRIFLINSLQIVLIGTLCGTLLGVGICLLQQQFGFVRLNEATYYVRQVPVFLQWTHIVMINLLTVCCCLLLLIIPSFIIRTITPVKALRFN